MKEYLAAARALADDDFEPEMFDRDEKGGDGWDCEEGRREKRTRTLDLDFGARQPLPPVSPPAYGVPAPPQTLPVRPARPESGTMMMALPTLGKNAPWKGEVQEPEDEFTQIRL